jgi:RNA polymerase sigma factor (sigma-70 family)
MVMPTSPASTSPAARELVLDTIAVHASSLLAVARRYSICADDAYDAYQRAMEIFLRRADSLDPAGAPAWLRTVIKHEALAVRAARQRLVGPAEVDLDHSEARELEPAEERAASTERVGRSAEALTVLKPHELRALVLKARGYSYREIAEITGWTYTKVNRCITEGRRAFLDRFEEIETGRACERWEPALSALADGEASAQDVAAVRPHLRHCPACRARLRDFRAAPRAVAALAPALPAAVDPSSVTADALDGEAEGGLLARMHDALAGGLHERVLLSAHKLQAGVEAASAGKLAAVAASATALAGSGAAALHRTADRPASARTAAAERAEPETAPPRRARPRAERDAAAPTADRPGAEQPVAAPARPEPESRSPTAGPSDAPGEFDFATAPAASSPQAPAPASGPRVTGSAPAPAPDPAPSPPPSPSEFGP